jgi:all-trans-nonaprenyl-diphosphate synthase
VGAAEYRYGTRLAVLAGDYLFAQSSWFLANLDNLEVIKLISQVIADFANGEISQAASLFDCDVTLEQYMDKSFYKTASLIAASCRSAAVFSGMDEEVRCHPEPHPVELHTNQGRGHSPHVSPCATIDFLP